MLSDPRDLRIPGPTPVPPEVVAAMSQPMIPHRGEEFAALFAELLDQLRRIHGTKDDVFVIAGSGSSGWEAAIVNTLAPGDTVIAAVNGMFGERFVSVARRFDINISKLDFEYGRAVDPDAIRSAIASNPSAKAVQLVHNETSTGVLNPIEEIGPIVRNSGATFIVDSVSGLGGAPVKMDTWNLDIVFSGSQKALMCPPGLSIIGVGERVWERYGSATFPKFTFDFKRMKEAAEQGSTPSTAPVSLIYGLKVACDLIEAEGLDVLYRRHEMLGDYTRLALRNIGVDPIADPRFASPTVTVARLPEGVSAPVVQSAMRDMYGIEIATGQAHLRETCIRIGHMGWTATPELERTIRALDDVLEHLPARDGIATG